MDQTPWKPAFCGAYILLIAVLTLFSGPAWANQIGATIIKSRSNWTAVVGTNVTLDCEKHGLSHNDVCAYIAFTWNGSVISEDERHRRSGPVRISGNVVKCMMTITAITLADAGDYGCCWGTDSCQAHLAPSLTVIPPTTAAPTTTAMRTRTPVTITTTVSTVRTEESNEIVYNSIRPTQGKTGAENDAQTGNTSQAIHRTIWPLLLVAAVITVLAVIGYKYFKRRETRDALPPVTDHDPEMAADANMIVMSTERTSSHDDISCISNGLVTTTTTTTTVMKAAS